MRYLLFTILSVFLISGVDAQIDRGMLEMKVTNFEMSEMPQVEGMPAEAGDMKAMMKSMFESMSMKTYFKPDMQVTKMNMMGMMNMEQHYHDGQMIQYTDVMGQKVKIVSDLGAIAEDYGLSTDDIVDMYDIAYDQSDKRDILGYSCYKVEVKMNLAEMMSKEEAVDAMMQGFNELKMTLYLTEEIEVSEFHMQQMQGLKLPGMPLMMIMDMGPMKMTYEAVDFSKDVTDADFAAPRGDYKEMSLEDLKKMGMGNMGFGF